MKIIGIAAGLALMLLASTADAHGHGGHYVGGHGSSHRGGHYVNAWGGQHYSHHRRM